MHLYEEFKEYESLWEEATEKETDNILVEDLDKAVGIMHPLQTDLEAELDFTLDEEMDPDTVPLAGIVTGILGVVISIVGLFFAPGIAVIGLMTSGIIALLSFIGGLLFSSQTWSFTMEALDSQDAGMDLDSYVEQAYRTIDLKKLLSEHPEAPKNIKDLDSKTDLKSKTGRQPSVVILTTLENSMHKHPKLHAKLGKKLHQKEVKARLKNNEKQIVDQIAKKVQQKIEDTPDKY